MAEPNIYTMGGPVQANNRGLYISRHADKELLTLCKAGNFAYVLTPRQMGKSSLMIRTAEELINERIQPVIIDLQQIGTLLTAEQWYRGLLVPVAEQLNLHTQIDAWWQSNENLGITQRWIKFFQTVVLAESQNPIVVFVDEIDTTLSLDFTDDFFAAIRFLYVARATQPELQRLSFVLIGVATPGDLIQDPQRTPFNIAKGVDLCGFQSSEVQPLEKGLEGKTNHPNKVLKAILRWTDGQPFLTQKVCKLVATSSRPIFPGSEDVAVEQIVQSQIIENWESQDDLGHLRTISDRLTRNKEKSIRPTLRLYGQIIQRGEIDADQSPEQVKLLLTGCVAKRNGKLRVYNPIYERVFNQNWLEKSLSVSELCYFAEAMNAWKLSSFKDKSLLLRGKALSKALSWSDDKNLSRLEKIFLRTSQTARNRRSLRNVGLIAGSILAGAISAGSTVYFRYGYCPINKGIVGEHIGTTCFRTLITSGEKVAFLSRANYDLTKGIESFREAELPEKTKSFKQQKYNEAINLFDQAKAGDPGDPTPWIYFNNSKARLKGNPLKIAVVTSIDYYEDSAKEVLRGVADAQNEFNSRRSKNDRLLEIVIANDVNIPVVSRKVANDLASDTEILGVIGHYASESTISALPVYEKNLVPVVSPTSSSSNIKGNFFFRAISSTTKASQAYSDYIIKNKLKLNKIAVFYNPGSEYSNTLKSSIEKKLSGKVDFINIDITHIKPNIKNKIQEIYKNRVKAFFFIPNSETNSVSIAISRTIYELSKKNLPKPQLFGAMSLSETINLENGKESMEELTLFTPCLAQDSQHAKHVINKWEQKPYWQVATERWGQEPYWRVSAGYDAAQAFIKAIEQSKQLTRREIWNNLKSLKLAENETSGFGLDWSDSNDPNSDTKRKYCLYQFKEGKLVQLSNK
jgi:ABC-type branched-subunit amino acid transport system substrate-binding protein